MVTVSLCMIVKNEEETIGRCLESVRDLVDEIIVVDTGSTDRTKEIVRRYTEQIYDFQWINDFSAARNNAFSKATMDYQFWLDADDYLTDAEKEKFMALKKTLDPGTDVVMMLYDAASDPNGHVTLSYQRERWLRRDRGFRWQDPVHEYIQPSGRILQSDIHITHGKLHEAAGGRNLAIYRNLLAQGKNLSPRSQLYYASELYYNGEYAHAVGEFEQFLTGGEGWIEDNIKACYFMGKSLIQTGEKRKAMETFIRSFIYDLPRAEICSEIGYLYKVEADWDRAIFWFETAARLKKPENSWGFFYEDYWGFIPWLELCVCYFARGDRAKAAECHRQAARFKPDDPAVLFNESFFGRF